MVYKKKSRRSYGSGTITQNTSINRYQVRWTDATGRRCTNSTFPLTRDGYKAAQAFLTEVLTSKNTGITCPYKYTAGQLIIDYLRIKATTLKPQSFRNYKIAAKHYATIQNVPLQRLTSAHVQNIYNTLIQQGTKPATIQRFHALIHGAVQYALRQRLIAFDPLLAIELPGNRKTRKKEIFSTRDYGKMFYYIDHRRWWKPYNYRLFFRLLAQTGARAGEICALKFEDINWATREIHIQRTVQGSGTSAPKTEAGDRKVPILYAKTYDMLVKERAARPDDTWIFESRGKQHIHYTTAKRTFNIIRKAAGISKGKTMHTFRHSWATIAVGKSIPIIEISRILGHHKTSITLDVYGHAIAGYNQTLIEMFQRKNKD